MRSIQLLVILLVCVGKSVLAGEESTNWNQFRGPNGSGVANSCRPPVIIGPDQVVWRVSLPSGKSSPVLWGERLFLTGVDSNRLVTLAIDTKTGNILWKRLAPEVQLESVHTANSAAASTPCVDETRVYVYFGSYGLLCYDHDGQELWSRAIPTPRSMYGMSTSPILYGQRIILVLDDDADLEGSQLSRSKVIALDKKTGDLSWETHRPYNRSSWSTPMIWKYKRGADLVILGNGRVYGYDPVTGEEKWYVNGFAREPIAVPVAGDGQLYVSVAMQGGRGDVELDPEPFWNAMLQFDRDGDGRIGRHEITEDFTLPFRPELPLGHPGFGLPLPDDPAEREKRQQNLFSWRDRDKNDFWTKAEFTEDMAIGRGQPYLAAIRPGAQGDVTDTHVNWHLRSGIPEIPSPVFHSGRLYLVRDGGVLSCVLTDTGEVIYRERLGATGQYSASPVIANDVLYLISTRGVITVVKAAGEFEVVCQADLQGSITATPAMDQASMYIRTDNAVLCFR